MIISVTHNDTNARAGLPFLSEDINKTNTTNSMLLRDAHNSEITANGVSTEDEALMHHCESGSTHREYVNYSNAGDNAGQRNGWNILDQQNSIRSL